MRGRGWGGRGGGVRVLGWGGGERRTVSERGEELTGHVGFCGAQRRRKQEGKRLRPGDGTPRHNMMRGVFGVIHCVNKQGHIVGGGFSMPDHPGTAPTQARIFQRPFQAAPGLRAAPRERLLSVKSVPGLRPTAPTGCGAPPRQNSVDPRRGVSGCATRPVQTGVKRRRSGSCCLTQLRGCRRRPRSTPCHHPLRPPPPVLGEGSPPRRLRERCPYRRGRVRVCPISRTAKNLENQAVPSTPLAFLVPCDTVAPPTLR